MEKKINLAPHSHCTGCAACHDACPKDCINMQFEGLHAYPVINEDVCVKCGKCMKACPAINPHEITKANQDFYCAWSNEPNERLSGTSGGVGSALSNFAIKKGYYVCGSSFTDDWKLMHKLSNDKNDIASFKGSKYLQSNTQGIFKEIKKLVLSGEKILFIGTPCQIAALREYMGRQIMETVVTCEIICHGVNSPNVWNDYVGFLQEKYHSQLKSYNFRSKKDGWGQNRRGSVKLRVAYRFANGRSFDVPAWKNLFHVWFGQHYMLRESCIRCSYRKEQREADLTIGDFWGLDKIIPGIEASEGASVLITSSDKGRQFVKDCNRLHLIPVDGKKTSSVLKGFLDLKPSATKEMEIKRMHEFEQEYAENGFDIMAHRYPAMTSVKRIINSVKFHLHIK